MNELYYERLILPTLLKHAATFSTEGILSYSSSGLIYLDIDDRYILELFPLLHQHFPDVKQADYFGMDGIGAHVSVVYPEEAREFPDKEFGKTYSFSLTGLYSVILNNKKYYVLLIHSQELIALREKYDLPKQLNFKSCWIDFHITLGKIPLPAS